MLLAVLVQSVALVSICILFGTRLLNLSVLISPLTAVVWVTVLSCLCLLLLLIFTILFHRYVNWYDDHYTTQIPYWIRRWQHYVLTQSQPPMKSFSLLALEGLSHFASVIEREDRAILLRTPEVQQVQKRFQRQLGSPNLYTRLTAMESLAALGNPLHFDSILDQAYEHHLEIRFAAIRLATHLLTSTEPGAAQKKAFHQFSTVLTQVKLPPGIQEEALAMTKSLAPRLLTYLLVEYNLDDQLLCSVLHTVGRLQVETVEPSLIDYLDHRNPAVVAATLNAISKLSSVSIPAADVILRSMETGSAQIRQQAASALFHVPLEMAGKAYWLALADPIQGVRQAAIESLLRYGPDGIQFLETVARENLANPATLTALLALLDPQYEVELPIIIPADPRPLSTAPVKLPTWGIQPQGA
jgi:HEAT repeat protein